MVNKLAPKWTPRGFAQRYRAFVRRPDDLWLALQIGYFMWRVPALLRRRNLRSFLADLRECRRPAAPSIEQSQERIARLRALNLRLPFLRSRDNCYVRALTLYRFLDAGDQPVKIHFGIEEQPNPHERLRGHAWISVGGQHFDAPDEIFNVRIKEVPLTPLEATS